MSTGTFKRTLAFLTLMLVGSIALAGCGTVSPPPPVEAPSLSDYVIGPGDKVKVVVLEEENMEVDTTIGDDGLIEMHLLGGVQAAGRTAAELKADISKRLGDSFIVNPTVSVEITTFRPFFILGQVNQPGDFPFQPDLTIRKAVAVAGGFTRRADTTSAILVRNIDGVEVRKTVSMDTRVFPGDLLEIDRRLF